MTESHEFPFYRMQSRLNNFESNFEWENYLGKDEQSLMGCTTLAQTPEHIVSIWIDHQFSNMWADFLKKLI